ncbi:MAG: hypothetical protein AAFQ89_19455 [Cyanobacteria bacterium J06626_18]
MPEKDTRNLFRQEALERLSSPERLDELMTIVNLKTWLPLGTIGILLGLGLIWSLVGRIPVTTSGRGKLVYNDAATQELVALLYFDNRYRGQFRPGMPVVLMPETLLIYNEPGVKAEVVEIVESPALTLQQVRQTADIETAVSQQGQLEVLAQLPPMVQAMPQDTIVPGVVVEGRVTLEERAPITFVFPFLAR